MIPYEKKIRVHLQKRLLDKLLDFSNTSACAGIKGDSETVNKMAINNFGSASNNIPARPWVEAATGSDELQAHYGYELIRAIKRARLSDSSPARVQVSTNRIGEEIKTPTSEKLFSRAGYGKQGTRIMRELANVMARNQVDYINRHLATANAESTIRKKGFDKPLVETGKSVKSIRGWTE